MSKGHLALLPLAAIVLLSSGCARTRGFQGYIADPTLTGAVQPGVDDKNSVESTLGRPTFMGQFTPDDWYYVSRTTKQYGFGQPKAIDQSVLHLRFDRAGNVALVEKKGMEQVVRISPNGDKTPTLGRNRTFWQDLFGNIGRVGAGGLGGGGTNDNTGGS